MNWGTSREQKKFFHALPPFDRVFSFFLVAVLAVVDAFMLVQVYHLITVSSPGTSGTLVEGVVGIPRTFNPLFTQRQSEYDVTALLHRGLTMYDPRTETFIPALASEHSVSDDKLTYDFTLRDDIFFHDNSPVTAHDVLFTIRYLRASPTESALKKQWEDIQVEAITKTQVRFTLPYAKIFIPQTILPVLPAHIWNKVPVKEARDYQGTKAFIGAGPFMLDRHWVKLNGVTDKIRVKPFSKFYDGKPFVAITLLFYQTTKDLIQAMQDGHIDAIASVSPFDLRTMFDPKTHTVRTYLTHRVFAGFFNIRDGTLLSDPFIRAILVANTDQKHSVGKVFGVYATPLYGPLTKMNEPSTDLGEMLNKEHTTNILHRHITQKTQDDENGEDSGGEETPPIRPLKVVIPNIEEAKRFIQEVAEQWSSIGLSIDIRLFDPEKYSQEIVAKRDFDIFFYGYEAGSPEELFTHWHSTDPESFAVLSGYGNSDLNDILKTLQTTARDIDRDSLYTSIKVEFEKDNPAIFFYSPKYIYIVPKELRQINFNPALPETFRNPSNRYTYAHTWFINTKRTIRPF